MGAWSAWTSSEANALSWHVRERENKFLISDPFQNSMGSSWGHPPLLHKITWKSVLWFLNNPADRQTNKQTYKCTKVHRLYSSRRPLARLIIVLPVVSDITLACSCIFEAASVTALHCTRTPEQTHQDECSCFQSYQWHPSIHPAALCHISAVEKVCRATGKK